MIEQFVNGINEYLWGLILVYLLGACGIWFTVRLGFIQIRHFGHMFAVLKGSRAHDPSGISPFQALCTSLAARVGTGNLMGVAVAITFGGPGAVFWMWVIAFVGMATGFAESALGQLYKEKDENGNFRGGPAYYMKKGLNSPVMAVTFSLCLLFCYGLVFNAVQAYSITDAFKGGYGIDPLYTGIVIAVLSGIIVCGGLKQISRFAELVVPFMGIAYFLVALVVIVLNIGDIPRVLSDIITSAFGLKEAGSGLVGAAIMSGVKRGLFSNEAGMGSSPNAAAAAVPFPPHPVSQGYVQMLGVFFDTIVICTCTAVIILLAADANLESEGIQLTQQSLAHHVGAWGGDFITIALLFFAFTSIVANFAYADNNLKYLKLDNLYGRWILRVSFLGMLIFGAVSSLSEMIALADLAAGLMTVVNVVAILLLSKVIVSITRDYQKQKDAGELPTLNVGGGQEEKWNLTKGIWNNK